jgi:hypothetical protein
LLARLSPGLSAAGQDRPSPLPHVPKQGLSNVYNNGRQFTTVAMKAAAVRSQGSARSAARLVSEVCKWGLSSVVRRVVLKDSSAAGARASVNVIHARSAMRQGVHANRIARTRALSALALGSVSCPRPCNVNRPGFSIPHSAYVNAPQTFLLVPQEQRVTHSPASAIAQQGKLSVMTSALT